jgi:hypothetical protein
MEFDELMSVSSNYFGGISEKYLEKLEYEEMVETDKLDEQRAAQYVR